MLNQFQKLNSIKQAFQDLKNKLKDLKIQREKAVKDFTKSLENEKIEELRKKLNN